MRKEQVHSINYLLENRKLHQQNLTPAEARLWQALRGNKLEGRRFRRQHSNEDNIVDFYCPAEKLIIELDGQVHFHLENAQNDLERNAHLKQLGFTILRFDDCAVIKELEKILAIIVGHFKVIK